MYRVTSRQAELHVCCAAIAVYRRRTLNYCYRAHYGH